MALTRRRRRGLILNTALILVLAALGVTSYLVVTHNNARPAAATATVAVARGAVTSSVSSSGTVESARTATPQFTASGTVTAVLVTVGRHVAKGQALARIDAASAQRSLLIAEYNLSAAEDGVTAAEEALTNAEDAAASTSSSTAGGTAGGTTAGGQGTSVASAEASLARARADRESARQNVDAARADVTATTLRAPIAGTVTAVNGAVGSVTGSSGGSSSAASSASSAGTTSSGGFVSIADLTALRVVASFPEADALRIKAGQSATVTFNADPNAPVTAKLSSVSPTPTTQNGVVAYDATFALGKVPAGTRLGQTANVSVVTARAANALYVPTMAIATTGGSHTVVMADGQSRTVSIGIQGDTYTQITSGLADGDQIQLVSGRAAAAANGNTGRGQFAGPGQFPALGGQGGPVGQTGQSGQGANRGR